MNKRKILGTILGIIMFAFCLIYFTYAFYTWRSEETAIAFSIEDLSIEFETGPNVDINNIGPVLDYNDGVSTEFTVTNETSINIPVKITLDITFISENLKTKDFKYILLRDSSGGTNYTKKIASGNFSKFDVESTNSIIDCELVNAKSTYSYKFIVYIDGNVKNDINMQNNRLESFLTFEDSKVSYMTTFTSNTDESYFKNDTYRESIKNVYFVDYIDTEGVTASWDMTDLDNDDVGSVMSWVVTNEADSNYYDLYIGSDDLIVGTDFSFLFSGLTNVESINFNNFDTTLTTNMKGMFNNCQGLINLDVSFWNITNVTNMTGIFWNCVKLTYLDVSNWDTSNVTNMYGMFACNGDLKMNLKNLDVSNWDTSNVTNMTAMFQKCKELEYLDVSNWDTSNVTTMENLFQNCIKLTNLNVSNFDTSNVTNMKAMFQDCISLTSLDVSNFDTSNVTNMWAMFAGNSGNIMNLTSLDVSNFDTSNVTDMRGMFQNCIYLTTSITIKNASTSAYTSMFLNAATSDGASITVNYTTDTSSLVDSMIATKSTNSNVVKGSLV